MSEMTHVPLNDLERQLTGLAPRVMFPPTPDLASGVRSEIESAPVAEPAPVSPGWFRSPRYLAAAACVVLIGIGLILALFPGVRSSVARHLGLPGIEIVLVDGTATVVPTATGDGLLLGERVTLADARAAGGAVQIPSMLGEPDEVYIRQIDSGAMVSLLYYPRADLPNAVESGVGALLMQFPASDNPGSIAKRVSMGIASVTDVAFGDGEAYWITGETQLVLDQDPSKSFDDLIARDSGNVLLWQTGNTTFRLETALPLHDALAIAESVPVPDGTATP